MLIYHARRERLPDGEKLPPGQPEMGDPFPGNIYFTNQLLAGFGPWVYILDVPEEAVRPYEFRVPGAGEDGLRHFSLPAGLTSKATAVEYSALTGEGQWNRWTLTLHAKDDDPKNPWSQIWVSRAGVATARKMDRPGAVFEVVLTELFDPSQDYLIQEHQSLGGRKWFLQKLAGITPGWMSYPHARQLWANNQAVQDSAFNYIVGEVPLVTRRAIYATKQLDKMRRIAAWQSVSDEIGELLNIELGRVGVSNSDRQVSAGTWTSVYAMPMRIARRMSAHLAAKWVPPVPEPEWQDPNKSGRILLASPDASSFQRERPRGRSDSPSVSPRG